MSYVVLARKWRPMSFPDLVGQEHVSRTLGNAIEQDRVAHAFLFTGARGVGKTTSARIVAKALNCLHPEATDTNPIAEPCLKCNACKEIATGTDVDVREIDGASYTGIDEMRKLQETLPYLPARDRYKIIIIDEVHMLSQNAWNALLKTLEEPPAHVKFLFATTEVHKVPVTILSRVQRFDFKLIPTRLIAERVKKILKAEKIEADERAVALVAREAAGSMRDALSILDQGIAYSRERLVGEELAKVLGVASYPTLHRIAGATISGKPQIALQCVADLTAESCDLTLVARDLLSLFRDLVVAKLCTDSDDLLDLGDDERASIRQLSEAAEANDLLRLQQGFSKSFDDVARASDPRSALEMLLVKLGLRPALLPIDGLLARLRSMEARLASGEAGGGSSAPGGRPSAVTPSSRAASPQSASPQAGAARPLTAPLPATGRPTSGASPSRESVQTRPEAPIEFPKKKQSTPSPQRQSAAMPPPVSTAPASSPSGSSTSSSKAPSPGATPAASNAPQTRQDVWRKILSHISEDRPDILAVLQHAVPLKISPKEIALAFEEGSVLEGPMRSEESIQLLQKAAEACLGNCPQIKFTVAAPGEETLAASEKRARQTRHKQAIQDAREHPSVLEAVEVLGARVKRVELEQ